MVLAEQHPFVPSRAGRWNAAGPAARGRRTGRQRGPGRRRAFRHPRRGAHRDRLAQRFRRGRGQPAGHELGRDQDVDWCDRGLCAVLFPWYKVSYDLLMSPFHPL